MRVVPMWCPPGLCLHATEGGSHRVVVDVRDGAARRADDVVVPVLGRELVDGATVAEVGPADEAVRDEDVERPVDRRLVELRGRTVDGVRNLARREVPVAGPHERVPDERALARQPPAVGADCGHLFERPRRVRVRARPTRGRHRYPRSSEPLQRCSMPRSFQISAETNHVATKSATIT